MDKIIIDNKDMIEFVQFPVICKNTNCNQYYNFKEGKYVKNPNDYFKDNKYALINLAYWEDSYIVGASVQYDKNLDMLCVIQGIFSTKRPVEGEKRFWKETFRFYVDRKKNLYIPRYKRKNQKGVMNPFYNIRTNNTFEKIDNPRITDELFSARNYICINEWLSGVNLSTDYKFELFSEILFFRNKDRELGTRHNLSIKAVRRFFSDVFIDWRVGATNRINDITSFIYFLETGEIKGTKNDGQKVLDNLPKLSPLTIFDLKKNIDMKDNRPHNKNSSYPVLYIDNLGDNLGCVIRKFVVFNDDNANPEICFETTRVYILKDSHFYALKNNFDEWIYREREFGSKIVEGYLPEIDKEQLCGTNAYYMTDFINTIEPKYRAIAVLAASSSSIFEKLYKAGYGNLVKYYFEMQNRESFIPLIDLSFTFGDLKEDGKSLHSMIGLNKYQFDKVFSFYKDKSLEELERCDNFYSVIRSLKLIIGGSEEKKIETNIWRNNHFLTYSSIADVDNDSFDKIYDFCVRLQEKDRSTTYAYTAVEVMAKINKHYGLRTMINLTEKINMLLNTDNAMDVIFYKDYISMIINNNLMDRYSPSFNDVADMRRLHDEILDYQNNMDEEEKMRRDPKYAAKVMEQNKKFKERSIFWEKLTYKDKSFAVIYPETSRDLITEGTKLRHCVKSYIDRVANGNTNILFIRRVDEIDKPFFTAEVSNNLHLVQLHGMTNRNLSTEPELKHFIKKWTKEKGLQVEDIDRVM